MSIAKIVAERRDEQERQRSQRHEERLAEQRGREDIDIAIAAVKWRSIRKTILHTLDIILEHDDVKRGIMVDVVVGHEKKREWYGKPYLQSLTRPEALFYLSVFYKRGEINAIRYEVYLGGDGQLYASDWRLRQVPVRRRPCPCSPEADSVYYVLDEQNMQSVEILDDILRGLMRRQKWTIAPNMPEPLFTPDDQYC